jgi:hypothetical protein
LLPFGAEVADPECGRSFRHRLALMKVRSCGHCRQSAPVCAIAFWHELDATFLFPFARAIMEKAIILATRLNGD